MTTSEPVSMPPAAASDAATVHLSAHPCDNEFRRGWPILIACLLGCVIGVIALPFYSAGVFMRPLGQEFGWSRGELALGPTLLSLMNGFCAPLVGMGMDRGTGRYLISISLLSVATLLLSLSRLEGNIIWYWAAFIAMGTFGAGSSTLSFSRVINTWFVNRRGAALGIALSGTGIGAALGPPLTSYLCETLGWRGAYRATGIVFLCVIPLVVLPIWRLRAPRAARVEHAASRSSDTPGVTLTEAVRSSLFWRLLIAFPLIGTAAIGLAVHLIPIMTENGLSALHASAIAGLVGLSMIVARLLTGGLMDVVFAPFVGAGTTVLATVGLLLLATGAPQLAWCGAVAVGACVGMEFDLLAYLVARYFGMRAFGRIYGLLYSLTAILIAVSTFAYGRWADLAGGYRPALLTGALLLAIVTALLLTLPRFDRSGIPNIN